MERATASTNDKTVRIEGVSYGRPTHSKAGRRELHRVSLKTFPYDQAVRAQTDPQVRNKGNMLTQAKCARRHVCAVAVEMPMIR